MAIFIEYIGPEGEMPKPRYWAGHNGSDFVEFKPREYCMGKLCASIELPEVAQQMERIASRFRRYNGPFNDAAATDSSASDWPDIASNAVKQMTTVQLKAFVHNLFMDLTPELIQRAEQGLARAKARIAGEQTEPIAADEDEPTAAPEPEVAEGDKIVDFAWLKARNNDEVRAVLHSVSGKDVANVNKARATLAKQEITVENYLTVAAQVTVAA